MFSKRIVLVFISLILINALCFLGPDTGSHLPAPENAGFAPAVNSYYTLEHLTKHPEKLFFPLEGEKKYPFLVHRGPIVL